MKEDGRMFDRFLVLLAVIGVLIGVLAVVGMATRPDTTLVAAGSGGTPDDGAPPGSDTVTAHLTLGEWSIEGDLVVPAGRIRLEVHNMGTVVHNLAIEGGPVSADIPAGGAATLDVGQLAPGEYELICAIPGHKEAGMRGVLTVLAEGQAVPELGAAHGEEPDWAALDDAMTTSMLAYPAETEGRGNQLLEPSVLADGTKVFKLTAAITPWEVEPGKVVDAWAYNGMVPGPMIRLDIGDKVRVEFQNDLPMGTDIHWHGIDTPNAMDGVAPYTQPLVKSGETFVYEFVAEAPAVGMYHAHHHAQMQVPNGLFAPMIIGDLPLPAGTIGGIDVPEGVEVALEMPMVLNDAGVIGFSLNGKSFPATEPYAVKTGDWILVHYFNEGLQAHPMHLHQFGQLVIAKDGFPLDYPYWADTINVAPGERYSVLVQASAPGVWVWHCHILNHVEREEGMFGMVTALIVEDA